MATQRVVFFYLTSVFAHVSGKMYIKDDIASSVKLFSRVYKLSSTSHSLSFNRREPHITTTVITVTALGGKIKAKLKEEFGMLNADFFNYCLQRCKISSTRTLTQFSNRSVETNLASHSHYRLRANAE